MTHDYKRNGRTTLFAALNLLDGTVIGRCMRDGIATKSSSASSTPSSAPSRPESYPRHRRQLRRPQTAQGSPMARLSSALDVPFHADIGLLAQRRRVLLLRHHTPPNPTRSLPFRRPFADRDHTVHPRPQQTSTPTTAILDRSYGPLPPKQSSKNSLRSLYLLSESVHYSCRLLLRGYSAVHGSGKHIDLVVHAFRQGERHGLSSKNTAKRLFDERFKTKRYRGLK
jgi:hypothetical protein